MFTAVRRLTFSDALAVEIPALAGALLIAETCYKFHSFLLEGVAFLLTWWAIGGLLAAGRALISGRSAS